MNLDKPKKLRLFLAIDLPVEFKQDIYKLAAKLRKSASATNLPSESKSTIEHKPAIGGVIPTSSRSQQTGKWVEQDNLHATMFFLGSQEPATVQLLKDELSGCLSSIKSFQATLAGLGAFPVPKRARVLWLGISDGAAQMNDLSKLLGDFAEAKGLAPRDVRFHPHITLARFKIPANLAAAIEGTIEAPSPPNPHGSSRTANLEDLRGREFKVSYVSIFQSELSKAGPRYTELGRVYL